MGNEESPPELKQTDKLLLYINKSFYFNNDLIKGKITFYSNTKKCLIIFKKIEYWYNLNEFVERKNLKMENLVSNSYEINTQNNNFEFTIKLNNLEPSFEYYYNENQLIRVCFLRYILSIEIDNNIINEELISIKRAPISNFYKEISLSTNTDINNWLGLSKNGTCKLKIELKKNYFKINENIDITITIDNILCELKIKSLTVCILRNIYLFQNNEIKYSFEECYNKIEQTIDLLPFSLEKFNFSLKFHENLPIAPKNKFGLGQKYIDPIDFIPTCFGKIVQNVYFINAVIKYEKSINKNPYVCIPIFVGNKEENNFNIDFNNNIDNNKIKFDEK